MTFIKRCLRIGAAAGAALLGTAALVSPAHVELMPFPAEVRAQVPEVAGYRYIVAGDDVAIVDPRNRDIALVISE